MLGVGPLKRVSRREFAPDCRLSPHAPHRQRLARQARSIVFRPLSHERPSRFSEDATRSSSRWSSRRVSEAPFLILFVVPPFFVFVRCSHVRGPR